MFKAGTTCLELFEALLIEEQLHRWQTSSTTGGSPAVSRNTTDRYDSSIVPLQLEIMVTLDTGTRAHQLEPWKSQCKNIYLILYIYMIMHACMLVYICHALQLRRCLFIHAHILHMYSQNTGRSRVWFSISPYALQMIWEPIVNTTVNDLKFWDFPESTLPTSRPQIIFFWTHNCQGHEEPKRSFRRTGWLGLRWNEYSHENGPQLMRQVLPKSRAIDSLAGHD